MSALLIALGVQGLAMLSDELGFHRRRHLPRWERWGHPLDTLSVLAVFLTMSWTAPDPGASAALVTLMVFSCVFITKDEWIHARLCSGGEGWLHALLFVVHPTVFFFAWLVWRAQGPHPVFVIASVALGLFFAYQVVFWNLIQASSVEAVDNTIYDDLGERWYTAADDPVALLRAEARTKNPWVKSVLRQAFPGRDPRTIRVLDVGCGAGFLTNDLARDRFDVTGVDCSGPSLSVARLHDRTGTVDYVQADAYRLPFDDGLFDVVTCMDFLEHVEEPGWVVLEATRVLRPGGVFVFHTFNRSWLAGLVIIRGVEWFVKNTPPGMHVLRLFIKPEELAALCRRAGLAAPVFTGIAPDPLRLAFWRLLFTREVPPDFGFRLTRSTRLAYLGSARKPAEPRSPQA